MREHLNNRHELLKLSPSIDLNAPDVGAMRRRLAAYFVETFDGDTALFDVLSGDAAFLERPIPLRHPLIFYLGHTATFFVNKLTLARWIEARIDPRMESVFAVGVDEMSWDDLGQTRDDWPSVAEVRAYRARVRALVLELIETKPMTLPITWESPWWAIVMGIEHERIHIETSSVLIRQHSLDRICSQSGWPTCPERGAEAPPNALVAIPQGTVRLGRERTSTLYGWDNEYGRHEAKVAAFEASKMLVSNGEFNEFVVDGGYEEAAWWDAEGAAWRTFARAEAPTFWVKREEGWWLRLMTEEIPMPWDWPVEVNYLEAKAFCRWKAAKTGASVRLPTEDEWWRLFDETRGGAEALPDANIGLRHWASPCPVDRFAWGPLFDVIGNVWQWTETPIYPFDGFEVHPFYDDFTTPTFDGEHNLMKGGSWASTGNEAEPTSRYAFRRHFFQHAGFRYVVSEAKAKVPTSHYETDELMSQYAEFHFGASYFGVPNFSKALADLCVAAMGSGPKRTALDLGCASGRATFELARSFEAVTGVDFSARFIGQGVQLARGEALRYALKEEGELVAYRAVRLAELGLEEVAGKVAFVQGDACNLKPGLSGYDLILAANLIDRLYDPERALRTLHARLNVGGVLVIASPYTWLTEHTPRDAWIGGFKKDGERWTTLDGLDAILGAQFERVGEPVGVPFVIRETARKFQHTVSEVTVWRRRD